MEPQPLFQNPFAMSQASAAPGQPVPSSEPRGPGEINAGKYGAPPAASDAAQPTGKYGPPPSIAAAPLPQNPSNKPEEPDHTQARLPPRAAGGKLSMAGELSNRAPPPLYQVEREAQNPQAKLTAKQIELQRLERLPSVPLLLNNHDATSSYKYFTRSGLKPPPASSSYISIDQGNAPPRYMRLTSYTFPSSKDIAAKASIPLGLVVQPLADPAPGEMLLPLVHCDSGPTRCVRCRAYLSSCDRFVEGGSKYECFLCSHVNSIAPEMFSPLDDQGLRLDRMQRPELHRGSVEYQVGGEYLSQAPQPLTYVFVIDATNFEVLMSVSASLKAILTNLPDTNTNRFGFISFHSTVQFYDIHAQRQKPRMLVVSDLDQPELPLKEANHHLLATFQESKSTISYLLEHLASFFLVGEQNQPSCFGTAMQLAVELVKPSGGHIYAFQSSVPTIGAGALKSRLESFGSYLGTDRERELYKPQHSFYSELAEQASKAKVAINLFSFAQGYMDLATQLELCKLTGGQHFYYPKYSLEYRGKLHHELYHSFTRFTGYDAVLKIRTSTGLEVAQYLGDFRLVDGSEMELGSIHCDKLVVALLRLTGKIPEEATLGFQAALLYTTRRGERRLRVHSLQVPVSSRIPMVFLSADVESLLYCVAAKSVYDAMNKNLTNLRRELVDQAVEIVYAFRFYCSTKGFDPLTLILPEQLKLYPSLLAGLLKNPILTNGRINIDARTAFRGNLFNMPLARFITFVYPRLYALHKLPDSAGTTSHDTGLVVCPPWQRLLKDLSVETSGVYLLDNSYRLFMWVGAECPSEILQQLFGVSSLLECLSKELILTDTPSELLTKVKAIIGARQVDPPYKQLTIFRQGGENDLLFLHALVEDRVNDSVSHGDLLAFIHKQVAHKLGQKV